MIKSMTAFTSAERTGEDFTVSVEIRSYNHRYLDQTLRIPQSYQVIEDRIKSLVSERISRGRVEIRLQIHETGEDACAYEVDTGKARAYFEALTDLKKCVGLDEPLRVDHLTHVSGLIKPAEKETDMEARWVALKACLSEALTGLNAMRTAEGDNLKRDFDERVDGIESRVAELESAADGLLAVYQERLKTRIGALTQGMVEIDPARIAQEAAFLADRSDISEEIVRARSHIQQFRAIMASEEPAGRKLNFLLQEFNREFNTMGSKAGNTDIAHIVVDLKSELEKIREQVQNVE